MARQFADKPARAICSANEQKRPCTYCSHALILCEAFRAKTEQSIILTTREQNHSIGRAGDEGARRPKEPKMSMSMSRASATIYTFPPRGRYAIREQEISAPATTLPRGAVLSSGSGWYHEEAIQAASEAELGRKN
jgi:hypothetical protein